MKNLIIFSLLLACYSCNNNDSKVKAPDVSNIKTDLTVERFDRDFFAMDSNKTREGLQELRKKYPEFTSIFVGNILGLGPIAEQNPTAFDGTRNFIHVSKRVFDTAQLIYKNLDDVQKQLEQSFRFVKHYFPAYKLPTKIITMIGPMDALPPLTTEEKSPNMMGTDFVAIGLQFYLGKDFSIYNDPGFITSLVPLYRSRRFSREYIAADVMKVVIDDLYPDESNGKALAVQMIEKGKRLWLLNKLMPAMPDTIKTGFTDYQMKGCFSNEAAIWKHFREDVDLFSIEPDMIKNYIGESPICLPISEEAPGNIGVWVGERIMEAYEAKHADLPVEVLMKTDAKKILDESKYKPK